MRFEIKKLLCGRESWVLAGILVLFWGIGILRFEPSQYAKAFGRILDRHTGTYQEVRQEAADERAAAADEIESAVWNLILSDTEYYDTMLEKRGKMLAELEGKLEDAPTEYVRRDLQKAYRMYNKKYVFHAVNSLDQRSVVTTAGGAFYQYIYIFFLLAFFCGLFTREKETGMELLLLSSKKGKSVQFLKKISAAAVLLVPVAFLTTVIPFLGLWCKSSIPLRLLSEPLQCVRWVFEDSPYNISIGGLLLISCLLRVLVGLLIIAIVAIFSVFWKRSLPVLLSSAAVCVGMALSGLIRKPPELARFLYKTGGFGLLSPYDYFRQYDTVNMLGLPCTCLTLAVCFTAAFALLLLVIAYALFVKPWKQYKI